MGLSLTGLGVPVLSSVIPGAVPDPEALTVVSEVPEVADAKGAMIFGGLDCAGADVVGERRMLKRALCSVVVRLDGADFRLSVEGAA